MQRWLPEKGDLHLKLSDYRISEKEGSVQAENSFIIMKLVSEKLIRVVHYSQAHPIFHQISISHHQLISTDYFPSIAKV